MIRGIEMNSRDKEMLAVYRKTASFTMQALGETLSGLRKGISNGNYNTSTVELLKERLETLEECLVKIELYF